MKLQLLHWKRMGSHSWPLPRRATDGSAGFDMYWAGEAPCASEWIREWILYPNERRLFGSGWACAIPDGYVGILRERSSFAKLGGEVHAGVIDHDFRGEVRLLLANAGDQPIKLVPGKPVAQMLVIPAYLAESIEVEELDATARGDGGFGSTDR